MSRQAPVEEAVAAMMPLLQSGVMLVIVVVQHMTNCQWKIHEHFTPEEASILYVRFRQEGAYNYKMVNGQGEFSWTVYLTQKDY